MCFSLSLSLLQIYFVFSYMCTNMCGDREGVCRTCTQCPQRPEKGIRSPEPECELYYEGAGNPIAVLCKSSNPLTLSEPRVSTYFSVC